MVRDEIASTRSKLDALGVTAAAAVGTLAYQLIEAAGAVGLWSTLGAVVVVPIVKAVLTAGGRWAFDASAALRRVLLGKDWIEGTYVEVKLHHGSVGIVYVMIAAEGVSLRGTDYDADGIARYQWRSKPGMVVLEGGIIDYAYECEPLDPGTATRSGTGRIQFDRRGRRGAIHYTGRFTHIETAEPIGVEGWLLQTEEDHEKAEAGGLGLVELVDERRGGSGPLGGSLPPPARRP